MSKLMNLKIITPGKKIYEGQVKGLNTETVNGKITILPMHAPFIAALKSTTSKIIEDNKEISFFSSDGVLKVDKNDVIILCDTVKWQEDSKE